MAFLAPVAGAFAPEIEAAAAGVVGPEVAKVLSPYAKKGLSSLAKSGFVKKKFKRLANTWYGSKHHHHARKFLKTAKKVTGVLASKQAHSILKDGLKVGSELGFVNEGTAKKVLEGHKKAMQLHDRLSNYNRVQKGGLGTGKTGKLLKAHKALMESEKGFHDLAMEPEDVPANPPQRMVTKPDPGRQLRQAARSRNRR